ncbi:MAG TPA: hypothetical protein VFO65_12235 [Acidimicrobiales bacterium]|nr:hypothetical protein [Acidimicrobiales bacterium]
MRRSQVRMALAATGAMATGLALLAAPAWAALTQVSVGNFYFDDASAGDGVVAVPVGDQVRFVVMDGGPGTPHTVEVDELGIHSGALSAGETFTTPPLDRPGTYRLYCKPHDKRGHVATLVVGDGVPPVTAPPATAPPATVPPAPATTAAPTATTAPAAAPATTAAPVTTAAPARTAPAEGSSAPVPPTAAPMPQATPEPGAPGTAAGAGEVDGTVVPVGRGEATAGELAATPAPPGSLESLLGRRPAPAGPWTRSVRVGFVLLVPMTALGAGVAARSSRGRRSAGATIIAVSPSPVDERLAG